MPVHFERDIQTGRQTDIRRQTARVGGKSEGYRPINTLRPRQNGRLSQTTLSNAFSWIKMLEFRLRFHWSLFLRVQLTIIQHCFRQWLGAGQATSHYLNQWWLVYRRIYASLGLNELIFSKKKRHVLLDFMKEVVITVTFFGSILLMDTKDNVYSEMKLWTHPTVTDILIRAISWQLVKRLNFSPFHSTSGTVSVLLETWMPPIRASSDSTTQTSPPNLVLCLPNTRCCQLAFSPA